MNTQTFGIHIDDGSELLSDFSVKTNNTRAVLFDWQQRGIDYFFESNKVIYQAATGTGKSVLAIEIIKKIWDKDPTCQVLIVVPKNVILEDTWYKELYDGGINIPDIGVYYGKIKEYAKVTITNVQNVANVDLTKFRCLIIDECHNVTQRIYDIITQKDWYYLMGLSATFERRDNKHWKLLRLFDYNIFNYTPRQALADHVLNPFNFTSIGVEMDEDSYAQYTELTQQLNLIFKAYGTFSHIIKANLGVKNKMLFLFSKRKQLLSNYKRKLDVAQKLCKKHNGEKIIIFNNYNEQTNAAYWHLLENGVKACIVHSSVDTKKRDQNMIDFKKGKYNVMLTSKVLDEGYNLPKISIGIIMAGDSVKRQMIQRMGRVLRRKKDPSELYQLYCKGTIEEVNAIENNKFFKELCTIYNEQIYSLNDN